MEFKRIKRAGLVKYTNIHNTVHRLDGPAVIMAGGAEFWMKNNHIHRIGGPAYIGNFGHVGYYINGVRYDEEEYWKIIREKYETN